jgi:hypothetical protein
VANTKDPALCNCVRLVMRAFWGTEVVDDPETLEMAELARQEQWVREWNKECGVRRWE